MGNDDPRVFNAIVAGRVKNAVNKALQAKGYKEVTSRTPDSTTTTGTVGGGTAEGTV